MTSLRRGRGKNRGLSRMRSGVSKKRLSRELILALMSQIFWMNKRGQTIQQRGKQDYPLSVHHQMRPRLLKKRSRILGRQTLRAEKNPSEKKRELKKIEQKRMLLLLIPADHVIWSQMPSSCRTMRMMKISCERLKNN